jgi:hypothetical protein
VENEERLGLYFSWIPFAEAAGENFDGFSEKSVVAAGNRPGFNLGKRRASERRAMPTSWRSEVENGHWLCPKPVGVIETNIKRTQ